MTAGTKALAPVVFHRLRAYLLGHTSLPQPVEYTHQYAPHYLPDQSSSLVVPLSPKAVCRYPLALTPHNFKGVY